MSTLSAASAALAGPPALPRRIVGGYWPNWWPDAVRLRDLPERYNVVYLFAAVPAGEDGRLRWQPPGDGRGAATHHVADNRYAPEVQGRSIIHSTGGAGAGIVFSSRVISRQFADSVRRIADGLGGVDGLDFNTFEADAAPDLNEYAWISQQLKAEYGEGFTIAAPPAPWSERDKAFCRDLAHAGLLDLCGPQYYDGPGLTDRDYIVHSIGEWAELVGPERLCLGLGLSPGTPNYLTVAECAQAWRAASAAQPDLRGAFVWNVINDEATGWGFATDVGGLVAE
jgi:hypothetical protein